MANDDAKREDRDDDDDRPRRRRSDERDERDDDDDRPRRRRSDERDERDDDDDRPRRRRRDDDDYDDDDDDRPRRRKSGDGNDALNMVAPVNVSGSAIIAGYAGLLSCFPVIGFIFAIVAIVCGLKAVRANKQRDRGALGEAQGMMRAWFGIIMGVLILLLHVVALVAVIIGGLNK
ncbi:MAG: hypothetical protein ACRCZF_13930 [Gemmataceae bacterium]